MPSPRRRRALAALPIAALAALAGCTATNPQTTTLHYDPADGENVNLGQLSIDSILVVAKAGTNGPGTLVARLTNDSSSSRTVTFTGSGSTSLQASFTVPAGSSVAVGPHQERSATMTRLGSEPGGLVQIRVGSDGGTTRSVTIPVLTNTQPEFASLVPTTAPSPTATSGGAGTATSAPGASSSDERGAATGSASATTIRSSASASSNLQPSTRSSLASSPAAAAGSSAGK